MEKRNKYAEVLLNAYNDGVIKIIWSKSGFSIAIDPKRKKMIPEANDKEFINYAFKVIKMVVDLAEDRKSDENHEGDLEIAKAIYDNEYDLENHLYIKKNSKIDCFKLLEYEIISHRNEEKPEDIVATSAILKMTIEDEDDETSYVFEVSRRDIDNIIKNLMELKEKIDII
ncbi:MAG: hypothetical protein ACI4D3_06925 [Lachnospiraceae bacterium]